ncbi:MAG: AmmeMemoRadiSam system radical SAM enzyme [Candidatus Izemoplasmatales bacterium]|jgi:pyruvate formate lyase activating enzyme
MKEAILYQTLADSSVVCLLCGHHCHIKTGSRGICGVRENRHGKLFSLNYGLTAAIGVDPIEKKPLYHYLHNTKTYSLATVGCNLHCRWCQNYQLSQEPVLSPGKLSGNLISPEDHVKNAISHHCPSIAYTYSEPTIFIEYALDIMKLAHAKGLKNIWVTNGFMSKEAIEILLPYLDAANVDLKAPKGGVYEKYCGGNAETVMANLINLHKEKVHLEITTLVIPGINDGDDQLSQIAEFIATKLGQDVPWHLSRFFPGWKLIDKEITPYETLAKAKQIAHDRGLKNVYLGNV